MMPIEKELYPRSLQPTLFLNAEQFQWASNVDLMYKLGNNSARNIILTLKFVTNCYENKLLSFLYLEKFYLIVV